MSYKDQNPINFAEYVRTELNEKQKRRLKLIEEYIRAKGDHSNLIQKDETSFEKYIYELEYPTIDDDEHLIEISLRYCIFYLEELDLNLKLNGLKLLKHLICNITPVKLNLNMRSRLVFETLERYINFKDSLIFLEEIIQTMCLLLNVIETKYSQSEHQYKKHSLVVDILLNNCYMTTKSSIKLIYLKNLELYIKQMNIYFCRHLEKCFTVCFECLETLSDSKVELRNMEQKIDLFTSSLELIQVCVQECHLRIHAHSKRIITFLIKLIYNISLSIDQKEHSETNLNAIELNLIKLTTGLFISLFENMRVKGLNYEEFQKIKSNKNLNKTFLKLIENI